MFPDQLKIAKVVPILKKGDTTTFNNYRPISLLPAMSKVIEIIIFNQLSEHLENNKLLNSSQYGFRSGHSTDYAALELIDRLITKMDRNEVPINIYLDLSKAFDIIDHFILIDKLKYYGISEAPSLLLKNYLTDRKKCTEMNNVRSNSLSITTGVPQGSIIGPLLFILYINDFSQASNLFDFIMYADDTTLSSNLNKLSNNEHDQDLNTAINNELTKINDGLKENKLSLNVNKSKYMIFEKSNKNIQPLDLEINLVPIERVYNFNLLGLLIDNQLNWKKHNEKIVNICSQKKGILNKLKHILPMHVKTLLYNSLILPHLN